MKKVQIQGIFFNDINELFRSFLDEMRKGFELSDEEFTKKIKDKKLEVYDIFDEYVIDLHIKHNKFNVDNFLSSGATNQKQILKESRESFTLFIFYINACVVFYEKTYEAIKGKRNSLIIKIKLSLYGIILRRAQQIVSMLLDGYSDGAMIIWRSMYEYAISFMTIAQENSNQLAKRYVQHSLRNTKKGVKSYTENFAELNFKAPPKRAQEKISNRELKLESLYGKDFLDNDYGWANDLFPGKVKANIRNLEERLKMNRFRPYYLLCTYQIHSGFNGLAKFMVGNKVNLFTLTHQDEEKVLSIDPMQFTLGILHEVTDYMLDEFSDDDEYFVNLKFLRKIYQSMVDSFSKK